MSQVNENVGWRVIEHSQKGASHERSGLPNQDAVQASISPDGFPPVVLAVADGHGSPKSFRSQIGSQLAVATTIEVCRDFLDGVTKSSPSMIKQIAEQQLPGRILQHWHQQVVEDHARHPFSSEELDRLAEVAGQVERDRAASRENISLAYGTTLLATLISDEYMISFQLGDGEILEVSSDTREVNNVIPRDESLIANETSSLCQEDALKHFRCRFRYFQNGPPGLVLLSTDGYANSFASYDGFKQAGSDFLRMLQEDGFNRVDRSIPDWLEEASREGSGDDVTLGIIIREDVLPDWDRKIRDTFKKTDSDSEMASTPTDALSTEDSSEVAGGWLGQKINQINRNIFQPILRLLKSRSRNLSDDS